MNIIKIFERISFEISTSLMTRKGLVTLEETKER
jgi:hypothetical protein